MKSKTAFLIISLLLTTYIGFAQDYELIPYRVKNKWGFSDAEGNLKIKPKYDDVTPFNVGYAAFKRNGKWGFIDTKGKEILKPRYDSVQGYFTENYIYNDAYEKIQTPYIDAYIKGELLTVDVKGKPTEPEINFALYTENYVEEVPMKEQHFEMIKSINANLYGFINNETHEFYEPVYDSLVYIGLPNYPVNRKFILAQKNDLWGIIDMDNNVLTDFSYDNLKYMSYLKYYTIAASKKGLWGLITLDNTVLCDFLYDTIKRENGRQQEAYYVIEKNGKQGILSHAFKEILPPNYTLEKDGHFWYFTDENNKVGLLAVRKFEIIIPPKYDWIKYYSPTFILFKNNGLYGFKNKWDKKTITAKYKHITPFKKRVKYTYVITINGQKGYINELGFEYFKD